jgi:hypothetical protein
MNDLLKKIEAIRISTLKINEYYENNLKFNSVSFMATQIKALEEKVDGKANMLEIKKLAPRVHEIG